MGGFVAKPPVSQGISSFRRTRRSDPRCVQGALRARYFPRDRSNELTNIHGDRSVTVTGHTGTIRLPAEYIAEHLELGYAQTSHATQGRTVDTALLLVDALTDSRGIYTPMTRGREANHAYVAVEGNRAAIDVLTQAVARDWADQHAVARRNQLNQPRQLVL